ncbi:unnamed protein product [Boreogadus saida]
MLMTPGAVAPAGNMASKVVGPLHRGPSTFEAKFPADWKPQSVWTPGCECVIGHSCVRVQDPQMCTPECQNNPSTLPGSQGTATSGFTVYNTAGPGGNTLEGSLNRRSHHEQS